MVDFEKIIHRFKEFKRVKTQKEIAEAIGISDKDFSNRKRRGTLLPLIIDSTINESVNLHWLLKGEGEMFTKTSGVSKTPEILKKQEPDPKMMNDLFPEQTAMDIKGLEKRFDLLRQAADIDREITLGLMIKLREYLDQQIGNMRNEKESQRDE